MPFARLLLPWLLLAASLPAQSKPLQSGVIVLNDPVLSPEQQTATFDQLTAAHVTLIRCDMRPDDAHIAFARRAFARGIRIDAIIDPQLVPGTQPIQNDNGFYHVWGSRNIEKLDAAASRAWLQSILQKLDAAGVTLGAIEAGNEINWAAGAAKIQGEVFNYDDLRTDPRAQLVAKYYLDYLKVLAAFKEVRDQSRLNRQVPLLTAGFAAVGSTHDPSNYFAQHGYAVAIPATLRFMEDHGLDQLVDDYAIHYYPREKTPAARKAWMNSFAVPNCKAPGATVGKPCWITEWGFDNGDLSCPVKDGPRTALVQETMADFRELNRQGRLPVVVYYTWNSQGSKAAATSLYRCGSLSPAGVAATTP